MAESGRAPSLGDLECLAAQAFAALPDAVRAGCAAVVIRVAEFPDDGTLDAIGIEDPFDLTGLYDGVPLTEKSLADPVQRPDLVWLFRRPILNEWIERGDVTLAELVTHVLVHELAHHLGWSDERIAEIDRWWE